MLQEKFSRSDIFITKFEISGKKVDIEVFFSRNCLKKFLEHYEKKNTYKKSFAKVCFYMYSITKITDSQKNISEVDFLEAKEDELQKIINFILLHDKSLEQEYNKVESEDIFESFYIANKNFINRNINLSNQINQQQVSEIISPDIKQIKMSEEIRNQVQRHIDLITKPFLNIDFSLLTYNAECSIKHELLMKFGWFYLNELPDEIINRIYEKRNTINKEEVDLIIVNYFRNNNNENLNKIVEKWSSSRYFKSRKQIFHEALGNHSRKYYNSSITLLTLHTEGIITDFFRIRLQTPKYRAEKAIEDVVEGINNMPMNMLNSLDWEVYDIVFKRILKTFNENFEVSNPDKTSNNSRHKIAHGHVVERETEINSLKKFLYINEIYRLFSMLDEEFNKSREC